jgi:hypothetical protein
MVPSTPGRQGRAVAAQNDPGTGVLDAARGRARISCVTSELGEATMASLAQ